jgi:diaminopimelate epimerase
MIVHNADGTIPEMCGNGLRCVAWALVRSHGFPRGEPFVVETDAGPRTCEVLAPSDASDSNAASVANVVADVGAATVLGARDVTVLGRTFALHEATTGNPHAVHFGSLPDDEIGRFGPALATHPSFPNGVNVGFARLAEDGGIDLVVWERGVGRTLACGTGASAAAAIASARGLVDTTKPVRVRLPGGPLSIVITPDSVQMTGPARFVFHGTWHGTWQADVRDDERTRGA